jgi:hypothetical protein
MIRSATSIAAPVTKKTERPARFFEKQTGTEFPHAHSDACGGPCLRRFL